MIQQMHLTTKHIVKASKKLDALHKKFTEKGEGDAIYDFARMLKHRVNRVKTARGFATAYDKAVTDIGDENKVPEAWDKSTKEFVHSVMPFVTAELFGKNFAEKVANLKLRNAKFRSSGRKSHLFLLNRPINFCVS